MELISIVDLKNYNPNQEIEERHAARAIIFKDDKLTMVYNQLDDCYLFPGGGIKKGETHLQALSREVEEEAGLVIIEDKTKYVGTVLEIRQSGKWDDKTFHHYSHIYLTEVEDKNVPQHFDEKEIPFNFKVVQIKPLQALEVNKKHPELFWILRENEVLNYILNKGL
jgi:8-oxo-dGTP pyrophosphatase MutT (NUDIX family)